MSSVPVTARGQVTFRKEVLAHLGVGPGGKVSVNKLPNGRVEIRAAHSPGWISDAFGFLGREAGSRLSIEEIANVAAEGWSGTR